MKLTRKVLTPSQMKRANITTCITATMEYIFFIIIILTATDRTKLEKIVFTTFFVVWYIITALFALKNIERRRAEVFIAVGFCIGFGTISYLNEPSAMMLIFPALLSLAVYLNEYLIIAGAASIMVFVVTKIIVIYATNPINKLEQFNTLNLVIICLVVCVFGGCRAVKRLIEFSTEETKAVQDKADSQLLVAHKVETIVNDVNSQFTEVRSDLATITDAINHTHNAMEVIANSSNDTATQTQTQSEKTNEIQDRLEHTNHSAVTALETTKNLKNIIENGKKNSDELAHQSDIVDESTEQISKTIEKLVDHVGKVSNITESILSISSQTNLLALNASIEAARAGEAGKGFAVVADEIRQLAEMTKSSTEQITQIMAELTSITQLTQSELKTAVNSIDVQREKVKSVNESSAVVEEDIGSLMDNMTTVSNEVEAVLNANEVIVEGISALSGISEEISASTEEGRNDMNKLQDSVKSFSGMIDMTSEALENLKETAAVQ